MRETFWNWYDNYYPTYWKRVLKRIIQRRTVCRNCWRYPFACTHLDKEIIEALHARILEDKNGGRPLPTYKVTRND